MTLDAAARQAAEAVGPRPSTLGPAPFPDDLAPGRWRHARRPAILLTAALAIALATTRLQLAAPAAPAARPSVAHIAVGRHPAGPAVHDGDAGVWVANTLDATVSHVDPSTDRVVATIGVGRHPVAVAAGANAIWVLDQNGDVTHIDPASDSLTTTLPVGAPATGAATAWIPSPSLAASTGAVWAANQDGTLTRVDATSGHLLTTTVARPRSPGPNHVDLAVALGSGGVWLTDGADRVVRRIDPASGRVVASIQLGLQPAGLATTATAVWVEDRLDGSLTCINPHTDTTMGSVRVVGTPSGEIGTAGLAADPDTVWVADPRADTLIAIDGSRDCSASTTGRR